MRRRPDIHLQRSRFCATRRATGQQNYSALRSIRMLKRAKAWPSLLHHRLTIRSAGSAIEQLAWDEGHHNGRLLRAVGKSVNWPLYGGRNTERTPARVA